MFRKVSFLLVLLALLAVVSIANAHETDGCYATASPAAVKEDESFTITIQCDNVPTVNNVFGFQIGTTRAGDYDVSVAPSVYTAGSFADISTGADSGVVTGTNDMAAFYAVTRKQAETVNVDTFSLGSFVLYAEDNLTVDGSVTVEMIDANFILSDINGSSLAGWLRDVNDITVDVTNIDLAWLSGDMVVQSDVTTIANLLAIDLVLGDKTYSATDVASYTNTFNMDVDYQYAEAGTPAGDGILNVLATADMTGHLMCSNAVVNLGDAGSATDVDTLIGTGGVITLLSGDADNDHDIDNADATLIGANIGTNAGDDRDVNGDGTVNVLDLVHVGRNFDTLAPTSCGIGS
jgi:hypothetical protein